MDLFQLVFEVIDMRSFSNLWYWIALAVVWSSMSHFVLGVPWDMVLRARRRGGQAMEDVEVLVQVNLHRLLLIGSVAGLWMVAMGSALLTTLGLLGFVYRVEFAQAVFLIAFPLGIVGVLSVRSAMKLAQRRPVGDDLCLWLGRHRLLTQIIGMLSIFVTAMWGMYKNLYVGPFGQ